MELGYYLHPDWQGKGIMHHAVKGIVEWGLREGGAEAKTVIVKADGDNDRSRSVFERTGEWEELREREEEIEWPDGKGGGKKKVMTWRWIGEGAAKRET